MKRILFAGLAAFTALAASAGPMPHGGKTKKYVAFGWEYSYLRAEDFLAHADEFDKTPLDGVGFNVNGDESAGRRYQCFREIMQEPRWTLRSLENLVEPMRRMSARKCFRESFVRSLVQPNRRIAWTDDAGWDVVSNNLRAVTWLAREARFRGIYTDIEDYTKQSQFFRTDDDPPYDELRPIVRRRARDVFRGIFEEYPDVTVFMFWILSDAPYRHYETDLPGFLRARGDLWPAFVNGILDVIPPTAKLVDGEEDAYKFEASRHDFLAEYNKLFNWDVQLVEPENRGKYRNQVSVSFGQYLDAYVNGEKESWYMGPVDGSRLKHFRQNLEEATSACDEYVWFWGERGAWIDWGEKLRSDPERLHAAAKNVWNEVIPGGLNNAFKAIKDPEGEFVPRIEAAIAKGKLKDILADVQFMTWKNTPPKDKGRDAPGSFVRENGEFRAEGLVYGGCYHFNQENLKGGETYYVKGFAKGGCVNPTVSFKSGGRGIYGRRNWIAVRGDDPNEWREIRAFVRVPEYADAASFTFSFDKMRPDESAAYRDIHVYKLP